jgi:hypothetical protein
VFVGYRAGQPHLSYGGASADKAEQDGPLPARGGCFSGFNRGEHLPSPGHHSIHSGALPRPLFVTQGGSPITRAMLVTRLHTALRQAGIPSGQYSGHSFRIGAATTAARNGMEVQTLGRWKSEAYKVYIRLPCQ